MFAFCLFSNQGIFVEGVKYVATMVDLEDIFLPYLEFISVGS